MIDLADIIARELAAPDGRDLQERLLQAMFMMERFRGIDAGWRDIVSDVAEADVGAAAIERLARALRQFIQAHHAHPDVGSAIWALGKLRVSVDAELYEVVLSVESPYSQAARDQAACALEDLQP